MAIAIITLAAEEEAPCVRAREGSHTWACRRRREGGRKECSEGGSFVNCVRVREQASKRAMGGRRSKIPNSRYRVGEDIGAQITIKRLHGAWDAHPVAVIPAVHSIIRHVSPLDAFVDVPSQFQRAEGRKDGRRLIILFCRPPSSSL